MVAMVLTASAPALAHDVYPDQSIGATDRRENNGIQQFDWPTDSPVALPVRSSAKALETIGGVDFRTAVGAPVYAVADGTVVSVGPAGVVIHHGKGIRSTYTELRHVKVAIGQHVRVHEVIGQVKPARDGGQAYFHFQVAEGTRLVDPMDFLPAVDPNAE
jgi:murein DD-endopeptidase MepM/ murein hydrolase activator NlpD